MNFSPALALFLVLSLWGCSGQIKGAVFLDADGDGIPGKSEKSLTNVTVKMTLDGQSIGKVTTDDEGYFFAALKRPGYYCLEVDEPALQQSLLSQLSAGQMPKGAVPPVDQNFGVWPPEKKAKTAKEAAAGQTLQDAVCGNSVKEESEECDDGNLLEGDGCFSCKMEKKKEEPAAPASPAAQPVSPEKLDSGVVCRNVTGLNWTVDIPIRLDYEADISAMPERMKQVRKTGESFVLAVPYPAGCLLKPLFIPDSMEVGGNDPNIRHIDAAIGRVDFQNTASAGSVELSLTVKDDVPLGKWNTKIEPVAVCPDGKEVTLPPVEIEIRSLVRLHVSQDIPAAHPGETVVWKVTVLNESNRDYDGIHVVAVPPQRFVHLQTLDQAFCSSGGSKIECHVSSLAAGESKTFEMEMRFAAAEEVGERTTLIFNASAKIADQEDPIQAEEASFDLTPP